MESIGSGTALIERHEHRADLYINRPDKRNALNRQVIADLTEAFESLRDRPEIRAVAFLGKGSVFSAGMDLKMMQRFDSDQHRTLGNEFHALLDTIESLDLPVVAGIKKAAIAGGFELTLPTDLRIMGREARYGAIEVEVGVFPHGGTTQRLPRLVGLAKAKEMILRAELIDPEEADRINLVTELTDAESVDERTRQVADELTRKSPLGIRKALRALRHTFDTPLEDGLAIERYLARDLYQTEDREEGFRAHLEGRDPDFRGQ